MKSSSAINKAGGHLHLSGLVLRHVTIKCRERLESSYTSDQVVVFKKILHKIIKNLCFVKNLCNTRSKIEENRVNESGKLSFLEFLKTEKYSLRLLGEEK